MSVLESFQERKLTSILINRKKIVSFFDGISPVFYTLFSVDQCSCDKSLALSSKRFVSVVFVVVVLVTVQFSLAVLSAIFFSRIYEFLFFPPLFFLATFILKRRGKFSPFFFLPSFSQFSIANFKHCWVISPFSPAFHPFRAPITSPFLSHLAQTPPSGPTPYSPELQPPVYPH